MAGLRNWCRRNTPDVEKDSVACGESHLSYVIKRGRRKKTVAVMVSSPTEIVVRAPRFLSRKKIREFVGKKGRWITERQRYLAMMNRRYPEKEFVNGERFLFLGKQYRLKLDESTRECQGIPSLAEERLIVPIAPGLGRQKQKEVVREKLCAWYRKEAERIIEERMAHYSGIVGVRPTAIKVKEQKSRWGSCSHDGTLRFNWKIVMAPPDVVDYLVVHELCHLRVSAHSPEFWKQVGMVFPGVRESRQWLKSNASALRW